MAFGSEEEVDGDPQEVGEAFCLGLADGAAPTQDLGGEALVSEDGPDVFVPEAAFFHQGIEGLGGGDAGERMMPGFVL